VEIIQLYFLVWVYHTRKYEARIMVAKNLNGMMVILQLTWCHNLLNFSNKILVLGKVSDGLA